MVEEHLGGAGLRSMRVLPGGLRNANYRLQTTDGAVCVLRAFAPADQPKQAEEALVLRHLAARAPDLPVPRLLGVGRWADTGQPYLLISFLPGRSPGRGLPGLGHVERLRFCRSLGTVMAQLHNVPPPAPGFGPWVATTGSGAWVDGRQAAARPPGEARTAAADVAPAPAPLPAPTPASPSAASRDLEQYERDGFAHALQRCLAEGWLEQEVGHATLAFVERRMPSFRGDRTAILVHHDLHADNVLLGGQGAALTITGIVDFEHARGRAAEYDWVMALWSLPPDGTAADYRELGPLRRAFFKAYGAVRPLHPEWRRRLLAYEMIKAIGFLVYKPAYADFLAQNHDLVLRLLALDA